LADRATLCFTPFKEALTANRHASEVIYIVFMIVN